MAEDALALVLYGYEMEGKEIPRPSCRESIKVHQGEFGSTLWLCHKHSRFFI